MKASQNTLLVSLLLLTLSAPGTAQTALKEELSIKLTSPDKTYRLNIGLVAGNVKMTTYSGSHILVTAEVAREKNEAEPKPNPNANKNANRNTNITDLPQTKETVTVKGKLLTVVEDHNEVRISPSTTYTHINLMIKVPKNMVRLKLSIAQSGIVDLTNLNGELEILNTNGPITLTNIAGSVMATTVTGDISVSFVTVTDNKPMAFFTLTGKIDLSFPASFRANMRIQSDAGTLYSDFDISSEDGSHKLDKTNTPTLYRAGISGNLMGKINNGGPEVRMRNMTGNLYLRKLK